MRDPIDDCVHCGFCLPACPTYVSWGQEMDSPRGRIYLMKGLRDDTLAWDAAVATHFDRCLGCMACVTACPSGVRYDVLIESTRAVRERAVERSASEALFRAIVFAFFPYAARMRLLALLFWVYSRLGLRALVRKTGILKRVAPPLARLEALAPDPLLTDLVRPLPARVDATGQRRGRAGLVAGCVQSVFFPGVNEASLRVLGREGYEAVVPPGQGCCGALSLHAGRVEEARAFGRSLMRTFDDAAVDVVVVNAAGCGSALKQYGQLFADDPDWAERARIFSSRVRDVCELLAEQPPRAARHPIAPRKLSERGVRIAYHDACHLAHAQGVRRQPRSLLAGVPGLTVCEIPEGDQCCGSAGIYNLAMPASADEIGERKVDNVLLTQADVLVSANPGCTLHLQKLLRARHIDLPALHPVEVLDRSIRGEPLSLRSET
jgi:glycolate oxidase iron-sulfur subunit